MTLTGVLLTEAETNYALADHLFRLVADDELAWTPPVGKGWMSVGQLLMHCASFGCGKAVQGFVTGDWGPGADSTGQEHVPPVDVLSSVATVSQAIELLAADRRLTMDCIREAGEENLAGRDVAAPWGGPEISLFRQLLHMIAHLAQHKGQLFYHLKLMGKDVSTSDLWGA